jgi:hypothetical protein
MKVMTTAEETETTPGIAVEEMHMLPRQGARQDLGLEAEVGTDIRGMMTLITILLIIGVSDTRAIRTGHRVSSFPRGAAMRIITNGERGVASKYPLLSACGPGPPAPREEEDEEEEEPGTSRHPEQQQQH